MNRVKRNAWRIIGLAMAIAMLAAPEAVQAVPAARSGVVSVVSPADAEGRFEKTLKVTGTVDMEVGTGSGRISVRTGTGDTVSIIGTIKANDRWSLGGLSAAEKVKRLEANPPIQQTGNRIVIGKIEDRELRENVSISYEIVTPAATRLRASTGSGSIDVDGLREMLDAVTGSGSIKLASIGAETQAQTGSGSIEANGVNGRLNASTGSGGIRAYGVAGSVRARTGSGSIEIEQTGSGGSVDADTGSGGITARNVRGSFRAQTGSGSIRVDGKPEGAWRIGTGSGGVTVRLPADQGFELDAHTSSGSITTTHPVTVQGTLKRHELRGRVRGGGPTIEISTSSGSIRVE